jgi:hypothetical protein
VRKLCSSFLRNRRLPEVTPEELLSEIWLKLLGSISVGTEDTQGSRYPDPADWSVDPKAPECDGRVVWLIEEIGGSEAISHRREDILRRRFGRRLGEGGRRMVQTSNGDGPEIPIEPDEPLGVVDSERIWRGLLITAGLHFDPTDDVSMLLQVLAENSEILDNSSGGRWPIHEIVNMLNARFPPPPWTDDRVDNAKRRLMNWVRRLKRENRLDDTDLEALFARVARQKERERASALKLATPLPDYMT